jgi:hypothetical protein
MDTQLSEQISELLNKRCLNRDEPGYVMWDGWSISNVAKCYNDCICRCCEEIIYICDRIRTDEKACSALKSILYISNTIDNKKLVLKLALLLSE